MYDSLKESNFQYANGKVIIIDNEKYFIILSKQLDITANQLITQLLYIELGVLLIRSEEHTSELQSH